MVPATRRRVLFTLITAGIVFATAEIGSRGYWALVRRVKPFELHEVEHAFYPELRRLERDPSRVDDATIDVLLLGASVLTEAYGDVPAALESALHARSDRPLRIHNLSRPGHTSRDSLNKYRRLGDQRFDAVFVYHSINELRANNVPPDRFRRDYSHMDWYREVNFVESHPRLAEFVTLPFTAQVGWVTLLRALGSDPPIGLGRPQREYLAYGADVKSAPVLEENLREILAIARERGDPSIAATYAWYVPADYSVERFTERTLDYRYQRRFVPIEVWGLEANVLRGLREHDRVLRRVGSSGLATRFLDLATEIPPDGRYWSDVCHPSTEGSLLFADRIADAILAVAPPQPAASSGTRPDES